MVDPGAGSRADDDWLRVPAWLGIEASVGPVPDRLDGAETPRPWASVTPHQVLIRFGDGPRILVSEGRRVTVQLPADPGSAAGPGALPGHPGWLLEGWAILIALLQRGDLSLHATAVQILDEAGGQVVAIAGSRGAGKSTTAMALRQAGHRLLVDDVTLLEFRDGQAWTTPFPRDVHVLADAAAAVGVDFAEHPPLAWVANKASVPPDPVSQEPHRLDRVVVLVPDPEAMSVTMTPLRGHARVVALDSHVRRDGIAPLVLGQHRYFTLLATLARTVPVWELRRPVTGWTLDDVVAHVVGLPPDPAGNTEEPRGEAHE